DTRTMPLSTPNLLPGVQELRRVSQRRGVTSQRARPRSSTSERTMATETSQAESARSSRDTHTTGAELLVEALVEQGIEYVFANFGSDHPALIEALAQRTADGQPSPRIVLCPHEF